MNKLLCGESFLLAAFIVGSMRLSLFTLLLTITATGHAVTTPDLTLYLFAASDCEDCRELKTVFLPVALKDYGDRVTYSHQHTDDIEVFKLLLLYEKKYDSESDESVRIFVGSQCLNGMKVIKENLDRAIADALAKSEKTISPEAIMLELEKAYGPQAQAITATMAREKFLKLKPAVIALAGLGDGINPCAFVTLVFFISVLTNLKKSRQDIFLVGLFFSLSVFLTYLLLGFGLLKGIKTFSVESGLAAELNYAVAGFTLIFSVLCLRDYLKCRRDASNITLKLPDKFRFLINRLIHTQMKRENIIFWSIILGVSISLLESVCTGQIYLPTLFCIIEGEHPLLGQAVGYLVLYNLMFIVPLLIVFGLAYTGVSSRAITNWFNTHVAASKLMMSMLFLLLTGLILGVRLL